MEAFRNTAMEWYASTLYMATLHMSQSVLIACLCCHLVKCICECRGHVSKDRQHNEPWQAESPARSMHKHDMYINSGNLHIADQEPHVLVHACCCLAAEVGHGFTSTDATQAWCFPNGYAASLRGTGSYSPCSLFPEWFVARVGKGRVRAARNHETVRSCPRIWSFPCCVSG